MPIVPRQKPGRSAWRAAAGRRSRRRQSGNGLARSRVQSLQHPSELAVGRDPPAARHASMEARSIVEMPIVSKRALCATGAYN